MKSDDGPCFDATCPCCKSWQKIVDGLERKKLAEWARSIKFRTGCICSRNETCEICEFNRTVRSIKNGA